MEIIEWIITLVKFTSGKSRVNNHIGKRLAWSSTWGSKHNKLYIEIILSKLDEYKCKIKIKPIKFVVHWMF